MSKHNKVNETKITRLTAEAHGVLSELRVLVAEDKNMRLESIDNIDVVSMAIEDYRARLLRRKERRERVMA